MSPESAASAWSDIGWVLLGARSSPEQQARRWLGDLEDRWRHVAGVAAAATDVAHLVPGDVDLLIAAAWLHDIGYAEAIAHSGFHPLDGARHLRDQGADVRLCALVANHTFSIVEAGARGLASELAREFPPKHSLVADILTYADMTTGPTGVRVTVEERLEEIFARYPVGTIVHESIRQASPMIVATVRRVEALMREAQPR